MRSITLVYYLLINTFFPSFSQTNLKNNQFYLRGKIIGQNFLSHILVKKAKKLLIA